MLLIKLSWLSKSACCFDIITTLFSCYGAPDHSDQSTDSHAEMVAHPVPQSVDYSVGHPALDASLWGLKYFPNIHGGI